MAFCAQHGLYDSVHCLIHRFRGWLTTGATVFDRRPVPELRNNVEVAVDIDAAAARDAIARGLANAVSA